jgi:hypothetical protein
VPDLRAAALLEGAMNDPYDNAQADKEALARYGEGLTHAWTVRHPFALAVATGIKPIENKKERPPMALMGKLIGIHAGLQWARKEDLPTWPAHLCPMPAPDDPRLTYGALIGVARLVGVVQKHPIKRQTPEGAAEFGIMRGRSVSVSLLPFMEDRIRPWWRGPWGWLLEEAVLLPEPIPMRGQQGLWRLPQCLPGGACVDDPPHECDPARWALEQWRKAREVVR